MSKKLHCNNLSYEFKIEFFQSDVIDPFANVLESVKKTKLASVATKYLDIYFQHFEHRRFQFKAQFKR